MFIFKIFLVSFQQFYFDLLRYVLHHGFPALVLKHFLN